MIPKKYQSFANTNNGLSARPCFIQEIALSIEKFISKDYLFKNNILEDYIYAFKNYLFNLDVL